MTETQIILKSKKIIFVILGFFTVQAQSFCTSESSHPNTALHISIDASLSVDRRDMELQMGGIKQALESSETMETLTGCGCTQVEVSFWAETYQLVLGSIKIKSEKDIADLSNYFQTQIDNRVLQRGVHNLGVSTNVNVALSHAIDQISASGAERKFILITGDGVPAYMNNELFVKKLVENRQKAESRGIIINAVAVSPLEDVYQGDHMYSSEESLTEAELSPVAQFYADHVVTRYGSLSKARSFEDYVKPFSEGLRNLSCLMM